MGIEGLPGLTSFTLGWCGRCSTPTHRSKSHEHIPAALGGMGETFDPPSGVCSLWATRFPWHRTRRATAGTPITRLCARVPPFDHPDQTDAHCRVRHVQRQDRQQHPRWSKCRARSRDRKPTESVNCSVPTLVIVDTDSTAPRRFYTDAVRSQQGVVRRAYRTVCGRQHHRKFGQHFPAQASSAAECMVSAHHRDDRILVKDLGAELDTERSLRQRPTVKVDIPRAQREQQCPWLPSRTVAATSVCSASSRTMKRGTSATDADGGTPA